MDRYQIHIRDLLLSGRVGIHPHEAHLAQRLRISVALEMAPPSNDLASLAAENVLSYEDVVICLRALIADRHFPLLENLAEEIAAYCLADPRVAEMRVAIDKLDALADVAAVGVVLERRRTASD